MGKKKRKKGKKWILIIGLIVVVGAAGALSRGKKNEKGIEVTTAKSELRDITSEVSATGKIFPKVEVKITSEVAGEILEIAVVEGQKVARGDLLARVNPDTLESQVRREEAGIRTARARAEQSRISLYQAERDYERLTDLHGQEFVSEDELERAETRMMELKASYEASLSQIQEREMMLTEAKDMLNRATIFSPMDGTISVMTAEVGERVVGTGQFEGTEIMRVADLDSMEVRIEVSETDIVNVSVGQKANVEIDALPDDLFSGSVTEIANSARIANQGSQEQSTTFEVRIEINDLDPRIRPGMTATADIETETVTQVVSVPLQAVTARDKNVVAKALGEDPPENAEDSETDGEPNQQFGTGNVRDRDFNMREARERLQRLVFVVNGSKVYMKQVETGIADNRFIEIKSGLEEGETIVSGSYAAISRELKHESDIRVKTAGGGAGENRGGGQG